MDVGLKETFREQAEQAVVSHTPEIHSKEKVNQS